MDNVDTLPMGTLETTMHEDLHTKEKGSDEKLEEESVYSFFSESESESVWSEGRVQRRIEEIRNEKPPRKRLPGEKPLDGPLVIFEDGDFEKARKALKAGLPVVVMPRNAPSPTPVPKEADVFSYFSCCLFTSLSKIYRST